MTDGINGVSRPGTAVTPNQSQPQTKVERVTPTDAARDGTDVVNLTNMAETLSAIQKDVGETAPIDRNKVEAIKQALAAGEYKLDPERIAHKFIEIEKTLGKL